MMHFKNKYNFIYKIPEMDVPGSEMNAVLNYLTMEIGWYYYHINYTKEEEKRIEKSRLRKIEPSQKKGRGKKVQNTNNPTSAIPNNANAKNPVVKPVKKVEPKKKQPNNPDESWAASSPGPSPVPEDVKNPRSKSKKTKKATEKQGTTDNAATAGLASTPLPRRNNPNRESSETANNNSPGRKKKPSRWIKTSEEYDQFNH